MEVAWALQFAVQMGDAEVPPAIISNPGSQASLALGMNIMYAWGMHKIYALPVNRMQALTMNRTHACTECMPYF